MLVQIPSKILKADLAEWKQEGETAIRTILLNEAMSGKINMTKEIVLPINGKYEIDFQEGTNIIILNLFGQIKVNSFLNPIKAGQTLTLKNSKPKKVYIENNLTEESADFLLIELKAKNTEDAFILEDIDFSKKNILQKISNNIDAPNFIGLFTGRSEVNYPLQNPKNSVFGMVLNGAFEFQNRLLETRDGILLWGISELEFEALGEDALILFLEV